VLSSKAVSEPSEEDTRISKLVEGLLSPWQVKRARKPLNAKWEGGRAPLFPLGRADEAKHWRLVAEVDGPGKDPQVVLVQLAELGSPAQGSGAAIRQLFWAAAGGEFREYEELAPLLLHLAERENSSESYLFHDEAAMGEDFESSRRFAAEEAEMPEIAVGEFNLELDAAVAHHDFDALMATLLSRSNDELALDLPRVAAATDAVIQAAEMHLTQRKRAIYLAVSTIRWPLIRNEIQKLKDGSETRTTEEIVDDPGFKEGLGRVTFDELADLAGLGGIESFALDAAETPIDELSPGA